MTSSTTANLELDGKIAVVTGSARGIGRAIALLLCERGAHLVLNHVSDDPPIDVENHIRQLGRKVISVKADMADAEQIHKMVEKIKEFALQVASEAGASEPRVDILVHNAAIAPPAQLLPDIDIAQYDRVMAVNSRGPLILTQALGPYISDGGRIISVSSASSRVQNPRGQTAYGGSKALLEFFTRVWACEFASRHITVNAVLPGATSTDLLYQSNAKHGSKSELDAMFAKQTPMGRVGTADDIAQVVGWLSSDSARWVTGQHIAASGGIGV
ncbi:hypothetical protein HDU85_002955 [Gaertneriomyces sp. JEL0708]|nr:hypothetical protein HDU85_002955 [Gaertneriomyces sp. JEL0708]